MTVTQPLTAATFGELLRHLRKRMQMTQQELGIALGYSTAQIARLEGGERLPDVALVKTTYVEALGLEHEPELAAQLIALAAAARDVHPTAPSARMNNLPTQLTRFIGRQREVAEVKRLVGAHRMVTLSGAGGVGKTRLAHQTGQELLGDYADGVWLVEYAPVMDAGLVVATCVVSLNLSEQPNRTLLEILLTYLKEKKAVIIFDNCEHVISACAELAEALLRGCPDIHILATSREPLGVPGEVVWRVPSMQTPDPAHLPSLSRIRQHEAIQLFYSIATAARSDFVLNEDNMAAVAQICSRVDGIPLAIEMAAAQVAELSEHEIAVGLAYGLALLSSGSRVALPRHRTLRATLDWSYSLLSESERILLAQLSVFAGGWTAEAAQAICADDPLATPDVLPALLQLARKSLVVATMHNHHTRYNLLETIRQYAAEKLHERGETNPVRERHLLHYLALLEETMDLSGNRCWEWLSRVEPEHNNVRAAFNGARERADTDAGEMMLRVAAGMRPFRATRNYFEEGLAWLEEALARGAGAPAQVRAKALLAQATIRFAQMDYVAIPIAEAALALFRECNDALGSAWCLEILSFIMQEWEFQDPLLIQQNAAQELALFREADCQDGITRCLLTLGGAALDTHQPAQARAYLEEALQLAEQTGNHSCQGRAVWLAYRIDPHLGLELCNRLIDACRQRGEEGRLAGLLFWAGDLLLEQCDFEQAKSVFEERITLLSRIGVSPGDYGVQSSFSWCYLWLGVIAQIQGDTAQAIYHLQQAGKSVQTIGHTVPSVTALNSWGTIMLLQGHLREAEEALYQSIRFMHLHDPGGLVHHFRSVADLNRVKGRWSQAARLMGVYDSLAPHNPTASPSSSFVLFMETIERDLPDPRAQLGDAAYEAEYAIGQAMTVDEAVAYALEG